MFLTIFHRGSIGQTFKHFVEIRAIIETTRHIYLTNSDSRFEKRYILIYSKAGILT